MFRIETWMGHKGEYNYKSIADEYAQTEEGAIIIAKDIVVKYHFQECPKRPCWFRNYDGDLVKYLTCPHSIVKGRKIVISEVKNDSN